MRLNDKSNTSLNVRTSSVLPKPGTPSNNTWPPANNAIIVLSTISSWPTTTLPISARSAAYALRNDSIACSVSMDGPNQLILLTTLGMVSAEAQLATFNDDQTAAFNRLTF